MKNGIIQQLGTPDEIYNDPANLFVAGFIGTPQMNLLEAKLLKSKGGKTQVELGGETINIGTDVLSPVFTGEKRDAATTTPSRVSTAAAPS